jgi:hypothetical protein
MSGLARFFLFKKRVCQEGKPAFISLLIQKELTNPESPRA